MPTEVQCSCAVVHWSLIAHLEAILINWLPVFASVWPLSQRQVDIKVNCMTVRNDRHAKHRQNDQINNIRLIYHFAISNLPILANDFKWLPITPTRALPLWIITPVIVLDQLLPIQIDDTTGREESFSKRYQELTIWGDRLGSLAKVECGLDSVTGLTGFSNRDR